MTEERKEINVRIRASARESYDFLQRLARDAQFRERLERHPREVLGEYGVEIDGDLPPWTELPSPAEIEDVLKKVGDFDEFGNVSYAPAGYAWLVMFLPFSMALAVDDQDEQGGAS
jgi:hypothetical protein